MHSLRGPPIAITNFSSTCATVTIGSFDAAAKTIGGGTAGSNSGGCALGRGDP